MFGKILNFKFTSVSEAKLAASFCSEKFGSKISSFNIVGLNIFIGQTESPLMRKAYLDKMSKSEMLLVMSGGMATLAGGVLAVYINFLGGDDPVQQLVFAKHEQVIWHATENLSETKRAGGGFGSTGKH